MSQADDFEVNLDRNIRKKLNFGKVCPKFTKGEECEECKASDQLYKKSRTATDEATKNQYLTQAKTLYAKSRIFMNAINVRDEDKTFPVRIYTFPPSVYDDLMGQIRGQKQLDPTINVFHPITGRNILITKKGSGLQTRYTVQLDNKPSELPNKEVLEKLKSGDWDCLPDLNKVEDFISQNYTHITTFANEGNIIRLLPAFDGVSIYKELKFHRFTVDNVLDRDGEIQDARKEAQETAINNVEDAFDPFVDTSSPPETENLEFGETDTEPQTQKLDDVLQQVSNLEDDIPF